MTLREAQEKQQRIDRYAELVLPVIAQNTMASTDAYALIARDVWNIAEAVEKERSAQLAEAARLSAGTPK